MASAIGICMHAETSNISAAPPDRQDYDAPDTALLIVRNGSNPAITHIRAN